MKVQINGKTVLELSETQMKVIKNDIPSGVFNSDMTRRCKYWLELPQQKYAHANQKRLADELKTNGASTIPTNLLSLAEAHADEYPPKYGYDDITEEIPCQVGDEEFSFSVSHRKVFRKTKESQQENKSFEEYLAYETEACEDRLSWILQHKYERCLERLKLEWLPKLEARGISEIPSDDEFFAELIFSQSDYKDRLTREEDEISRN